MAKTHDENGMERKLSLLFAFVFIVEAFIHAYNQPKTQDTFSDEPCRVYCVGHYSPFFFSFLKEWNKQQ